MALHWRPVGPEPASTYWQRRAVLATGAVLLLALLTTLLTGGGDASDTLSEAPRATPTSTATATATAEPTASASPGAGASPSASPSPSPTPSAASCPPSALRIEARTDADSYPLGGAPRLSLQVTNTGTTPCRTDLGQAAVELLVFSGRDRIWSSDDCAPGGAKDLKTLEPGEPDVQRVTWNAKRSQPGCKGDQAQAQAGTYRLHGRVGALKVEGDVFRFTG